MEVINYLLGYKNLKIYQDTDMFNFSLDSVLLANFVTLNKNIKKILDIGTGNAVIPIILSTKTNSQIDGIELQKQSYLLAKKSVEYNHLSDRINLINQDVNVYATECETEKYDVIVSNPPYFKVDENSNLNNKECKTIARHEIALNLDDLFKISKKILKNNGTISIVHRPDRLIEIIETMKKYNIEPKKLQFIYPKQNKDSNMILIEGRKNGSTGLKILKPLIVHDDDNNYTKEVLNYFE